MIWWPHPEVHPDPFPEPFLPPAENPEDDSLRQAIADLWVGRADPDAVARLAADRGVDADWVPRHRPLPIAAALAPEATLVRIATDADPASGNSGPDLVLGPVADLRLDRRTLQIAVALAAFFPGDDVATSPYRQWVQSRPMDRPEVRLGVQAIADAPLAPWRITSLAGDLVRVEDVLELGPQVTPPGAVRLRPPGCPFGPPRVGDLLVARIAREGDTWVATCPLAVPGPLPDGFVTWMRWASWPIRLRRNTLLSRAGLLRRRGHVLVRRLLEDVWRRR